MKKIHVHIKNENTWMDKDVFVEIYLPSIPRKGEYLNLGELTYELMRKAIKTVEIANRYCPDWFYGKSYDIDEAKEENLSDLNFEDAHVVSNISYTINSEIVHLELNE
jgi:hypothetical protein